jgi:hypothetical protein
MDEKQKDLDEVMKAENRRGRRPIDFEAAKRRSQTLRGMRKLLESATEEEFMVAIRAAGLRENFPDWLEALRIWHEYRPWRPLLEKRLTSLRFVGVRGHQNVFREVRLTRSLLGPDAFFAP